MDRFSLNRRTMVLFVALLILVDVGCTRVGQTDQASRPMGMIPNGSEGPALTPTLPKPVGLVNDFAGVLDEKTNNTIEEKLRRLQHDHSVDFAVVIVDSTGDVSMDDYSLAITKEWKVGSENGGLVLAVSTQDRRWRIQLDRKLESMITDEETLKIGELMLPHFKKNDFSAGLQKSVNAMVATLTGRLKKKPVG